MTFSAPSKSIHPGVEKDISASAQHNAPDAINSLVMNKESNDASNALQNEDLGALDKLPRVSDHIPVSVMIALLVGASERFTYYALRTPWRTCFPCPLHVILLNECWLLPENYIHAKLPWPGNPWSTWAWPVNSHKHIKCLPLLFVPMPNALCPAFRLEARAIQDTSF